MSPRASLPGVDELFGPRAPKDGEVISVALEQLVAASDNPRRDVGDVSDLAASIRSVGLLEPLIVCEQGPSEPFLVVAGHRRLAAAALAGLETVPAIVRRLTDAERTEIMVIENLQREGLDPLEEALAYRRLIDLGYSQRKLAERVGSSQATVSKRLALLNLPEAARSALDSGRITLEDAQALTKLNNLPERAERALAHRQNYGGIRAAVEAELQDHQAEEARATAEEALTAAGVRVVPLPDGGFYGRKEAALRQEGQWHFSGSHLEIEAAAHEGEPCHAATVTARSKDARTIWICTDPDRHCSKGQSELQVAQRDETASKREEARARRAAERVRAEFMAQVLAGPQAGAEATVHVLEVFVEAFGARTPPARIACSLLGLDPEEAATSWGGNSKDWQAPLRAAAEDRGSEGLATVALALAFATVEEGLRGEWHAWGGAPDRAHFRFLEALGYAPSDFETGKLREAELRQAEDEGQLAGEDAGEVDAGSGPESRDADEDEAGADVVAAAHRRTP